MCMTSLIAPSVIMTVQTKLSALRRLMTANAVDGYLVASADEHLNEYLPKAKLRRTWVSGFTGSVGDLLVGLDQAWLFVDFRYYEQADLEVEASAVNVSKLGLDDQPSLSEVLTNLSQPSFRLGYDPFVLSVSQAQDLQKRLTSVGVTLIAILGNLVDQARDQLQDLIPTCGDSPLFLLSETLTGESTPAKISRIREALLRTKTTIVPITKLDQIAWTFNLRGWDVPYNPVAIAYAIITPQQALLCTNLDRITDTSKQELTDQGIILLPYESYADTLISLTQQVLEPRVLLDPKHTTMGTYHLLSSQARVTIVEADHPVERMKAYKNSVEIAQMQAANLKSSRAKTRLMKWLMEQTTVGAILNERIIAQQMEQYYAEEGCQGLSFNTISATGANGSIVHYGTPNPHAQVQLGHLFLLDSGAQYLAGTTDDTRTFMIGEATAEQKLRYTEVLKAHINCAMQRFPKGTVGVQLDGIARSTMWAAGLDYGHGTGHGVGAFLNVHEGPNGIHKRAQEPLEPGMINSIEPGFYAAGWGGIRLENLYVVRQLTPEDHQPKWYGFESLTYIPFDGRLLAWERLSPAQLTWLTDYYEQVITKLSPTLEIADQEWLRQVCHIPVLAS